MSFSIYRHLEIGEVCVVGADTGETIAYCAAVGISQKYNDTPFTFHARMESSQFGYELYNLGLYVQKKTGEFPLLAVERNMGQATIAKLRDLEYPIDKLYKQKTFDRTIQKEEERIGFVTSANNRRKMLDDLALKVRNKQIKIYDEKIIGEMLTFVVSERTGEPRPESGRYSDLIMSLAIANQVLTTKTSTTKWVPNVQKQEDPKKLPLIAKDFIVEDFADAPKDWRDA